MLGMTLKEVSKRILDPNKDPGIDMKVEFTISNAKTGFIEGKKTVQCHSFVSNFLMLWYLQLISANKSGTIILNDYDIVQDSVFKDIIGHKIVYNENGLGACPSMYMSSLGFNGWQWVGPVVGTGTTAPTPQDYKLEEQLGHASTALSRDLTGVTDAVGLHTRTALTSIANLSDWLGGFLEITSESGKAAYLDTFIGKEYIINTEMVTGTTLNLYNEGVTAAGLSRIHTYPEFYNGTWTNITIASKLKTYGTLFHGPSSIAEPVEAGDKLSSEMTITRQFTNNHSIDDVNITEFGLYAKFSNGTDTHYLNQAITQSCLIARDVTTPAITLAADQILTLRYKIRIIV